MSTNVSAATKMFTVAQNGFTTTLASTIASGATTVPLNSVAGYTNGDTVALVIDPLNASKQVFTGVVDTAGVQVTNAVWTAGTNVSHSGGATVVDYTTATDQNLMTKGLLRDHNQSGYHKTLNDDNGNKWVEQGSVASAVNQVKVSNAITGTNPIIAANGTDANIGLTLTPKGSGAIKMTGNYDAWVGLATAPTTITALGNRSYTVLIPGVDYTGQLSNGMRLRMTRTVAAPTQCTSLNGTTQYYSRASASLGTTMTFTNNYTVSAWVKLSSYAAVNMSVISRYNATNGWLFYLTSAGQVVIQGFNGAGNARDATSYQSVPLNKWVHISGQLDMLGFTTATCKIMIDGVDVPVKLTSAGTNPTSLVQGGNLEVGSYNAGNFFPGKIAQAAVYGAIVSQATILASMHQTLAGTETSLISAYSFNGASGINDLNANANNLTANGSALATNADSPYGGQADGTISSTVDYGIITKTAFSTNTTLTVQVPEGCTIPTSGGVSAVSYSTQKVPYGLPAERNKWTIECPVTGGGLTAPGGANTYINVPGYVLNLPIGPWELGFNVAVQQSNSSSAAQDQNISLSTSSNSVSDSFTTLHRYSAVASVGGQTSPAAGTKEVSLTAATLYYLITSYVSGAGTTTIGFENGSRFYARFNLL